MTSRRSFRSLRPDLDSFLFATLGDDIENVPLSVVSALVRLGLDPWEEASRLSSLSRREAAEQLARLLVELPDRRRPLAETRGIAHRLVVFLPKHDTAPRVAPQIRIRPRFLKLEAPLPSAYWIICGFLITAALLKTIANGGFQFWIGSP